ncbi:hypothetical protein [Halorubrum halodurans]|uniref:hypothetical protein n=1 Tax=Halorubrum halodurans TaxID=1383851 RepID=UPI001179F084|nr:hypothetical protein [Halorubrum halodurans]
MRKTALGIGAFAGAGAVGSSTAAAQSAGEVAKTAAIYAFGGPAAAAVAAYGYVVGGPDDSEVADSLEWQTHVDEFTRAREDQLMLEQTIASLKRDVQLVGNKAREEAIFRIYEQAVDSGSESDATTAAENAIDETYATVERAVINSWNIRANRVKAVASMLGVASDSWRFESRGYEVDQPDPGTHNADVTFDGITSSSHTLLDGSSMGYMSAREVFDGNNGLSVSDADPVTRGQEPADKEWYKQVHSLYWTKPDYTNYDTVDSPLDVSYERVEALITPKWAKVFRDLYNAHSTLMGEVSSMVSTYYQPAKDGEVDLTQLQGPAYLAETAKNASDFQEATMALRSMGFKIAEQASVLSVQVDGSQSEYDGRLARTVQSPDPLPVETEILPSNVPGSIYGAINVEDADGNRTGEIVEITNPFTIVEAEGGVSEVTFKSRQLAESDTTSEEIETIFRENYEANKEAEENVYDTATGNDGGGGGAGGFLPEDQNWGTIALGAGALAIGWGYLTGGDE